VKEFVRDKRIEVGTYIYPQVVIFGMKSLKNDTVVEINQILAGFTVAIYQWSMIIVI
jgi:hypothetical protein